MRPKVGTNYIDTDNVIVEVWAVCQSHVVYRHVKTDEPHVATRAFFSDNFKEVLPDVKAKSNSVKKPGENRSPRSLDWPPPG